MKKGRIISCGVCGKEKYFLPSQIKKHRGKFCSPLCKKTSQKGIKLTGETKRKMRQAQLGSKNHFFGKKHSVETRKKISAHHRGEKHRDWKGGITPVNEAIRHSLEYRLWREAIFKRDNYTCVWCGDSKGGNLQADHIKAFAYFPELRFAIDNGRTLCYPCHKTTFTYGQSKRS